MIKTILLDSTPLGLLTKRAGARAADEAQQWLAFHLSRGVRFIVPEIVDYELRRELLRLRSHFSLTRLDAFNAALPDRYLPVTTTALRVAADLWATARQQGFPTADHQALDVDVILAAQALSSGLPRGELVVATGNLVHLTRFVPSQLWDRI
jgi:predicted nucleic acid-binding protein